MLKFSNGFSINLEYDEGVAYMSIFNTEETMCEHRSFNLQSTKEQEKFIRLLNIYGSN